ncbi:MAG: hypothetical protein HC802_15355 [Caldilineaceae bacterium]|nr:hypothetical protein [Caldilineaceae bacterium]
MRIDFAAQWEALFERALAWRWRMRRKRPVIASVDYRDRISVVTWLIVFGLGLSLLFDISTRIISFTALGSPVSIPLSETTVTSFFLAVLAAVGAESVLSTHPRFAAAPWKRSSTWPFWALPMALTIISVVLLPLAPSRLIQVLALLVSGALMAVSLYCLYATVEPGRSGFRRARLVLDALAYGSALLLFLFVYQTRTRSLLSGSLVAITAILLALEILRTTTDDTGVVLSYGAIIGLILGQVTWALNYWVLPGLTGSLLLLLIFYLLVGIAQQGIQGRLSRRVAIEFAVFAAIALVLIAVVGPGFG